VTSLQLFACIGMITGFFILLRLSPADFAGAVFGRLTARPKSIKDEINEATKRKKPSLLRREIAEAQSVLALTGRSGRFMCFLLTYLAIIAFEILKALGGMF